MKLASEVFEGETQSFDKKILLALRDPADSVAPDRAGLDGSARRSTSPRSGSATVLGLTVFFVAGFLLLQGLWRRALFVMAASFGGWFHATARSSNCSSVRAPTSCRTSAKSCR